MALGKQIIELLRRIYNHFDTPPAVIEVANYRFYFVCNIGQTVAWVTHAIWMFVFYALGVHTLAFIQIGSILAYVVGINANRRGLHILAMIISMVEIVTHQIIAVRFLGADGGFQYYIPVVAIFPFLIPKGSQFWKWLMFLFCLAGYLYIEFFMKQMEPLYHINPVALSTFHIANIILVFALFAIWAIYLSEAVNRSQVIIEEQTKELTMAEEAAKQAEMQLKLELKEQENKIITKDKQQYEELLLNILPFEVAQELKEKGKSEAKMFDHVTVMFTDFKDFTKIGEQMSAGQLVKEIDYCFSSFDKIIQKFGIEKIKTMGDSYMCAGGLPAINKTHATDVIHAAIEIRDFVLKHQKEREAKGETPFEIRIGINTGPVVAGIVGIRKFAYDIWGDTVNIASRMESGGEPGRINISGSTYEQVKDKFACTYRGKIEAKNKGEIDMYFVD
jgi:class 3 adenylate cyclase